MDVLNLKFYSNDLDRKVTIRQFFYELLKTLWREKECFSGKRPFGNSDWDGDLIVCLIRNEYVSGELDNDGYIEECDYEEIDSFITNNVLNLIFGLTEEGGE